MLLDTTKEDSLDWTRYPFGPQSATPGVSVLSFLIVQHLLLSEYFPILLPLESSESFRDWGALFAHVKWWWDRGNYGVWCIIHHLLLPPLRFWLESFFLFFYKWLFNSSSWCWWVDRGVGVGSSTSQLNRFASSTVDVENSSSSCVVVASACFLIGFSFS